MIDQDLQTIGLTQTEATIYTWLLRFGAAKPSEIAEANRLKRPTVYSAIGELQKKGALIIEGGDRNTRATAQPPHVLQSMVEQEARNVQEKKRAMQRVIDQLLAENDSEEYVQRDQFREIDDLTTHLTHRVERLMSNENIDAVMGWAYADTRTAIPFITIVQDVAAATDLNVPINILSSHNDHQNKEIIHEPPLHIKTWTGPQLFATNSLIIGHTAIYVYKKTGVYHTTEIADTIIVQQMKSVWSVLWNYDAPSAFRAFAI